MQDSEERASSAIHHRWFRRRVDDHGGTFWSAGIEFWRIKASVRLYRHVYPASSGRWVLQPDFVYDCREQNGRSDSDG